MGPDYRHTAPLPQTNESSLAVEKSRKRHLKKSQAGLEENGPQMKESGKKAQQQRVLDDLSRSQTCTGTQCRTGS